MILFHVPPPLPLCPLLNLPPLALTLAFPFFPPRAAAARGCFLHAPLTPWPKCRGGVTTDAMGWLKCGAEWTLLAPGRASTLESVLDEESNTHKHTRTHAVYPGSGPSCGGNTPTPACLSLIRGISGYKVLLELFHTHRNLYKEGGALSLDV